jgi:uncharacterized protein
MMAATDPVYRKPIPVPDRLTAGFWSAAAEGRLVMQRCSDCRHWQHPPGPICRRCYSTAVGFEPVSGRGRVYTYTVTHHRVVSGFDDVPYAIALVELDEQMGLRMLANLPGVPLDSIQVGMAVEVLFETLPDGGRLPQFTAVP